MVTNSLASSDVDSEQFDDTTGKTVIPPNHISDCKLYYSISMWFIGIAWFFIDIMLDINLTIRYRSENRISEMWCTLAFILVPSVINSAISLRMMEQDKERKDKSHVPSKVSRLRLRYIMLALLLSTPYHIGKTIKYALRYRNVKGSGKRKLEERYYRLLTEHDSDAVMLKVVDSFMEAAPQQVLQISVLMRGYGNLQKLQIMSISSSFVFMALCLVSYQSSIRNADRTAVKMNITGSVLQFFWHFFVTISRVIALSAMAYLFPRWVACACALHVCVMATWLKYSDRSEFCRFNTFAEWGYSIVLGTVYIFTYILSIKGNTRYRYLVYYTICGIENVVSAILWYNYADEGKRCTIYFDLILYLSIVPYILGLTSMVIYYSYYHHKVSVNDILYWKQGTTQQGTTQQGSTQQGSTEQGTTQQGTTQQGSTQQGSTQQGSTEQGTTQQGSTEQSTSTEEI